MDYINPITTISILNDGLKCASKNTRRVYIAALLKLTRIRNAVIVEDFLLSNCVLDDLRLLSLGTRLLAAKALKCWFLGVGFPVRLDLVISVSQLIADDTRRARHLASRTP
jgi:hypothetical protein